VSEAAPQAADPPPRVLKRRRTPTIPPPPEVLDPGMVLGGGALAHMAAKCAHRGISYFGRPTATVTQRVVAFGPGTDMVSVSISAINQALRDQSVESHFELIVIQEKDPVRLLWSSCVVGDECCICKDLVTFEPGCFPCQKQHKSGGCGIECPIAGFIGSFSGKDVQKLTLADGARGQQADKDCPFNMLLKHISVLSPEWLILEDKDQDVAEHPSDYLLSSLASFGYDIQPIMAENSEYGLPLPSCKSFIVGILSPGRIAKIESYDDYFRRFLELFRGFKVQPPSFDTVLFADDDPIVRAALGRCKEAYVETNNINI